jgi:polysaccharide export outer membrane protein
MKRTWIAAVAALLSIGSLAWAQDAPPAASSPTPEATTSAPSVNPTGSEYVIGPDDVLHIAVWKEADLTATLPVRPDGKISLPLLNDVPAAGLTPMQLASSLTEKLKKYLADPRVTVVVTQINSKRIYMVGEVAKTGPMPMLPNMTVLQALSTAGLTQFAHTKKIYVMRNENGKEVKMPVNYDRLVKGKDMDRNYALRPGDTIVVP